MHATRLRQGKPASTSILHNNLYSSQKTMEALALKSCQGLEPLLVAVAPHAKQPQFYIWSVTCDWTLAALALKSYQGLCNLLVALVRHARRPLFSCWHDAHQ